MDQVEEENLRRFKVLVGLEDVNDLFNAGIRTILDYVKADPAVLEKLTGQRKNELMERRIAGKIYLKSGLEPDICLRMVQAGAHNSCETLSLESENLELKELEEQCFQRAKLNIAYENIRGFLASGKTGDKDAILAQIEKMGPKEKEAAVKSVEIICTLRQFRQLKVEFERRGGTAIEPENLANIVSEIPGDKVRAIIENLDKQYADVLPPKEQASGVTTKKRKAGGASTFPGGMVDDGGDGGLLNTIDIEGIGPKYSAILADNGISTVKDLRIMNAAAVHAQTRISLKRLRKWQGAAILLQIPGVDTQMAEAFTADGYLDIRSIAYSHPMNLYHTIERARTPTEAKNIIPDSYQRVITPSTTYQIYKAAYDMYFPPVPPTNRQALSIAPYFERIPADEANYGPGPSNRWISYIVIHAMAGSIFETIEEFRRPNSRKASAHYLVGRSGRIVQMVDDYNVAFHAANRGVDCRGFSSSGCSGTRTTGPWDSGPCNCSSIGIELEDLGGYTRDSTWITDAMYRELANLVCYLCDRYGIPKRFVGNSFESSGILGHEHVVGKTEGKTDPGPFFNWNYFISLVDPQQPVIEEQSKEDDKGGGK